jgi:hypothetical protein
LLLKIFNFCNNATKPDHKKFTMTPSQNSRRGHCPNNHSRGGGHNSNIHGRGSGRNSNNHGRGGRTNQRERQRQREQSAFAAAFQFAEAQNPLLPPPPPGPAFRTIPRAVAPLIMQAINQTGPPAVPPLPPLPPPPPAVQPLPIQLQNLPVAAPAHAPNSPHRSDISYSSSSASEDEQWPPPPSPPPNRTFPSQRVNRPKNYGAYVSCLVTFMSYTNKISYPKDWEFSNEELAPITPEMIYKWFAYQAFGKENPSLEDNPTGGKSNSLLAYKKMLSFFMVNCLSSLDDMH